MLHINSMSIYLSSDVVEQERKSNAYQTSNDIGTYMNPQFVWNKIPATLVY